MGVFRYNCNFFFNVIYLEIGFLLYIALAALELSEIHLLGMKACTTMPSLFIYF